MGHADMVATVELLKAAEAAVVSGVGVRDVNRALDEGILQGLSTGSHGRRFSPAACAMITFYFGAAKRLTPEERVFAIKSVGPRLERLSASAWKASFKNDWLVRDEFLTIDMTPFVRATAERLVRLAAARSAVTSSPQVLGGAAVVAGTRIPVHDIAASRAAGHSDAAILAAYPSLTAEQIDLAVLYADANPIRGRPRVASLPKGAAVVSERRVPRRQMAG
jgi:uncharacterized protein (DUF433 family)